MIMTNPIRAKMEEILLKNNYSRITNNFYYNNDIEVGFLSQSAEYVEKNHIFTFKYTEEGLRLFKLRVG